MASFAAEFFTDFREFFRSSIVQTAVRALHVVFPPPCFDLSLRVSQIQKPISVQAFIAKPSVETLHMTVLHRLSRLDVRDADSPFFAPCDEVAARKLRSVVAAQALRGATLFDHSFQSPCDLLTGDPGVHRNHRALPGKAVHHGECPQSTPVAESTQSRTGPNQYSVDHLSAMIADLQNKRTELLSKFRPDDRLVLEVEQEITDTRSALERATKSAAIEESTDVNPVRQTLDISLAKDQADLAGIQARRQSLVGQTQSYRRQLMTLGNATAQFDDLTRARKEAEDNYLLYSRKTEEARIAESLDRQKIANAAIAETPVEPQLPSKPNVPMNIALGVLLAGFLSIGIAFSAEYFGQSGGVSDTSRLLPASDKRGPESGMQRLLEAVQQPSELEALTGLAVLATVERA